MATEVIYILLCLGAVYGQMHNAPSQTAVDHPVQLVHAGRGSAGEGRVEIYVNGTWSTVCDTMWDENDAMVVCRQLGFDSSSLVLAIQGGFYVRGSGPPVMTSISCTGSETDLAACPATTTFRTPPSQVTCTPAHQAAVMCQPYDVPIRLAGDSSLSEGRVEVFVNGQWGTICDSGWTKQDAQVVCGQLGFGSSRAQPLGGGFFGEGTGPIFMEGVTCTGLESNIVTCSFRGFDHHTTCTHRQDAGVVCDPLSIPVRLTGSGQFPSEGRVELFVRGEWGTVCNNGWDSQDADVVCRQLGFNTSRALVMDGGLFGDAEGPVFMDQVNCVGSESHLAACGFSGFGHHACTHQNDAGVMCLPFDLPVRLIGPSVGEGRVEVQVNGEWGTVCDDNWDEPDAQVVCTQLGFRSSKIYVFSKAFYGQGSGPIIMDDMQCTGTEAHLSMCRFAGFGKHTCTHAQDAGVNCLPGNFLVRLNGGGDNNGSAGRVELFINGTWGSVCDNSWDASDAEVVCRQLGFDSPHSLAVSGSFFGQSSGPFYMDSARCTGGEDHLTYCPSTNFGHPACSHDKEAGVICQLSDIPVRLVGGSESEGRVELNVNGQWGTVCDTNWDAHDTQVVCRQLGFNSSVVLPVTGAFYGQGTGPILMYSVNCARNEPHLALCPFQGFGYPAPCTHKQDAGVICQPLKTQVRLVGKGQDEGRVEVKVNGLWSSICSLSSSYWSINDAKVVCRQLGYNSSVVTPVQGAFYGEAEGPIILRDVQCVGTEVHILMCPSSYGVHQDTTCTHVNDVGVMCEPFDVRLVEGNTQFEGRLEVFINGEWGSVCDNGFTQLAAMVVCRQLGLNTSNATVIFSAAFGQGNGIIPIYNVACTGNEDYLAQCTFYGFNTGQVSACDHTRDVSVSCG